jgi:hypothetical protein
MPELHPRPFLDRPIARGCAVLVFLLSVATLGFIHREDLLGRAPLPAAAGDDALALCIEVRLAELEQMVRDNLLTVEQAERARGQLEPVCRAQTRTGGAEPPLPGLLPQ